MKVPSLDLWTPESAAAADERRKRQAVLVLSSSILASLLVISGVYYASTLQTRRAENRSRSSIAAALVPALEAKALDIWPLRPEKISEIEARMQTARLIQADTPHIEAALMDPNLSLLRDETRSALEAIRKWSDPAGLFAELERRLDISRRIEQETVQQFSEEWDHVTFEVSRDARFGGFEFTPQIGLVPLEPDPKSGLWEFWLWESGLRPGRDPAGRWQITGETGLVLVLLPGGTSVMGAQKEDESAPNYDPMAITDPREGHPESPVVHVSLAPFMISKFEMTQGQWLRLMGHNPSFFKAGDGFGEQRCSMACPVENVDWRGARDALRRIGLVLPTEAQWEYAARGGTTTTWWTGSSEREIVIAENLDSRQAVFDRMGLPILENEKHLSHTPAGSFAANPFGLYDVLGNVREWCQDPFFGYGFQQPRPGDGLVDAETPVATRVLRGGGVVEPYRDARSATRWEVSESYRDGGNGIRPVHLLSSR